MEELMDLPDDLLKKAVPKLGPWSKLCKARRSFMEKTMAGDGATSSLNIVGQKDLLEEFLTDLGLEQYLQTFRGDRGIGSNLVLIVVQIFPISYPVSLTEFFLVYLHCDVHK